MLNCGVHHCTVRQEVTQTNFEVCQSE